MRVKRWTVPIRRGKAVAGKSPNHLFCTRGRGTACFSLAQWAWRWPWGLANTSLDELHASVSDNTISLGFQGASNAVKVTKPSTA